MERYVEETAAALKLPIAEQSRAAVNAVMLRLAAQAENLLAFELGPSADLAEPQPE